MKQQLFTGVTVLASSLAVSSQEAISQTPKDCAPAIYNEFDPQGTYTQLEKTIGEFAARDIVVKVRVLNDAKAQSINNAGDARTYQIDTLKACNTESDDTLSVFISDKPRLYHVLTSGEAKNAVSDEKISESSEDFISDLKDTSTPYIEDAHTQLQRLMPKSDSEATASTGANNYDLPWKQAIGFSMLALLGAYSAGRVWKGYKLTDSYLDYDTAVSKSTSNLHDSEQRASKLTALAPNDSLQIGSTLAIIPSHLERLDDSFSDLTQLYRSRRLQVWPQSFQSPVLSFRSDRDRRQYIAESTFSRTPQEQQVSVDIAAINKLERQLSDQSITYQREMDLLPETYDKFESQIAYYEGLVAGLIDKGWVVDSLFDQVATFRESLEITKGYMEAGKVNKATKTITSNSELLGIATSYAKELPVLREQLDNEASSTTATIIASREVSKDAKRTLVELQQKYDKSCSEYFSGAPASLDATYSKAVVVSANLLELKGIKTVQAVEESRSLLNEFRSQTAQISKISNDIANRRMHLGQLEKTTPKSVNELNNAVQLVYNFIFTDYKNHMKSATRNQATELDGRVKELKKLMQTSKPRYLEIEKNIEWLTADAAALAKQARSQLPRNVGNDVARNGYGQTNNKDGYDTSTDSLLIHAALIGAYSADYGSAGSRSAPVYGGGGGGYDPSPSYSPPSYGGGGGGDYGGGGGGF